MAPKTISKLTDLQVAAKGQIKSEWIDEIINFPKTDPTNLKDFCPESFYGTYWVHRAEMLQFCWVNFLEN